MAWGLGLGKGVCVGEGLGLGEVLGELEGEGEVPVPAGQRALLHAELQDKKCMCGMQHYRCCPFRPQHQGGDRAS